LPPFGNPTANAPTSQNGSPSPSEYATPTTEQTGTDESIIESHTLIPDAMFHAFAAFAAMMSPDLPLERRQHEMIATMVSKANDCFY